MLSCFSPIDNATIESLFTPVITLYFVPFGISLPILGSNSKASPVVVPFPLSSTTRLVILAK